MRVFYYIFLKNNSVIIESYDIISPVTLSRQTVVQCQISGVIRFLGKNIRDPKSKSKGVTAPT